MVLGEYEYCQVQNAVCDLSFTKEKKHLCLFAVEGFIRIGISMGENQHIKQD